MTRRSCCWLAILGPSAVQAADAVPKLIPEVNPWQWAGALLLVFAALAMFLAALRRMNGVTARGGKHLEILAGISVGARERVVVLKTGGKQLVLGVSPGRIQTLCVLEGEDRIATAASAGSGASGEARSFAEQLGSLLGDRKGTS